MSEDEPDGPWLVVGLGNPGDEYARNRHNVGFRVLDALAEELGARFTRHRTRAQVAQVRLPPSGGRPGEALILAKPSVFMNESGGPVAGLMRFFRVGPERLLVVHDELDIPLGQLRLKRGGGEGGHNGLRSVTRCTGSNQYARLRMGVGRPPGRMDPADFVLRDFGKAERDEAELMVGSAVDAIQGVVRAGFAPVQTKLNAQRQ